MSGHRAGLATGRPLKLGAVIEREEDGMRGVAVKYIAIAQNPDCEGSRTAPY